MNIAPICLFVYNRLDYTKRMVESLQKNLLATESDLFIFSDGPKDDTGREKINLVREYLKTIIGFKTIKIFERTENWGLARSIITGVTEIVNMYGKVIVMEDDLITSPYFLQYMNEALTLYENDNRVISVHGYVYPTKKTLPETFFLRGADCWGWATWKRGWDLFERDGRKLLAELESRKLIKQFNLDGAFNFSEMLKRQIAGLNDSWAIRWHASAFLKEKLTLYPGKSLIENIGQDKSGTHPSSYKIHKSELFMKKINIDNIPIKEDLQSRKTIIEYFHSLCPSVIERIVRLFKKMI